MGPVEVEVEVLVEVEVEVLVDVVEVEVEVEVVEVEVEVVVVLVVVCTVVGAWDKGLKENIKFSTLLITWDECHAHALVVPLAVGHAEGVGRAGRVTSYAGD